MEAIAQASMEQCQETGELGLRVFTGNAGRTIVRALKIKLCMHVWLQSTKYNVSLCFYVALVLTSQLRHTFCYIIFMISGVRRTCIIELKLFIFFQYLENCSTARGLFLHLGASPFGKLT